MEESGGRIGPCAVETTMTAGLLFAAALFAGPQQPSLPAGHADDSGAQKPATSTAQPDDPVGELPVSLERIKRELARRPAIRLQGDRNVYRVEVIGRKPTIEDILGPDYLKGPTPAGAPTHQEFLDLVTPKDFQGYAAFSNREAMAVAATSFALQWALQRAIHKFETAKQERDREAARKEVQEALAELEKARAKAGLPPK
jgi:HAMP domain-containing protein